LSVLGENGLGGKEVGVVGVENMPTPFYEALERELGGQLRRVPDIVAQLRAVKSASELALMRHAAHLSDLGFETMLEVARPGMRGVDIVAEMERTVRLEGADHSKYWMASGAPPEWENVRLDLKPHERILEQEDLMASCSYVHYKGYWCHGQRTGALKKVAPELEELCDVTRQAQDAGLAAVKPGLPAGHIGKTIDEHLAGSALTIQGGRVGHGMGMDYAEAPGLSQSNEAPLEAGNTFVVHAAFGLPESGKMFVPLGDVCHVGSDGVELLMQFPRTPFVAGV
jgi:Xaa-Pro dipeptidase